MKSNIAFSTISGSALLMATALPALAVNGVGGDETNVNELVTLPAPGWRVLVSEPFQTSTFTNCIATGSLDAINPNFGDDNQYMFTLSLDNPMPLPNGACERTVEFDAHAPDAQRIEEVSSTCTFRQIPPGTHRIFWLARKAAATTPNMAVDDSSMTFVCHPVLLDLDGPGDGN